LNWKRWLKETRLLFSPKILVAPFDSAVNSVIAGRAVNQKESQKIAPLTYSNALAFSREQY